MASRPSERYVLGVHDRIRPPANPRLARDLVVRDPEPPRPAVPPAELLAARMDVPVVKSEVQRSEGDCGVACLTMMFPRLTYEQVEAVVCRALKRRAPINLMHVREVVRAAEALGAKVARRKKYDLDTACGILNIAFNNRSKLERSEGNGHYVVIYRGVVIDTDRLIYHWTDYERVRKQWGHAVHFNTLIEFPMADSESGTEGIIRLPQRAVGDDDERERDTLRRDHDLHIEPGKPNLTLLK